MYLSPFSAGSVFPRYLLLGEDLFHPCCSHSHHPSHVSHASALRQAHRSDLETHGHLKRMTDTPYLSCISPMLADGTNLLRNFAFVNGGPQGLLMPETQQKIGALMNRLAYAFHDSYRALLLPTAWAVS